MRKTKFIVTLAITSCMLLSQISTVFGEANGLIIKDSKTNELYKYDIKEVLDEFNKHPKWEDRSPIYDEFMDILNNQNIYLIQDSSGKIINYKEASEKFNATKAENQSFDFDEYMKNSENVEIPDYIYNRSYKNNKETNTINVIKDNAKINFKNKIIDGNLLISAANVELENAQIKGKVIINSRTDGKININNLQCDEIEILSGGNQGINLDNVKADKVKATCSTSILSSESTKIKTTLIDTDKEQLVNLSGNFEKIELKKACNIKIAKGSNVYIFANENAKNAVVDIAEGTYVKYKGKFIMKGDGKNNASEISDSNKSSSSHRSNHGSSNNGNDKDKDSGSTTSGSIELEISHDLSEINTVGMHKKNYVISNLGDNSIFGPSNGMSVIKGNLKIDMPEVTTSQSITLKNIEILGDDFSLDFGSGDVTLDNVKVNGLTVKNIGENSLHINGNTTIGILTVNDTDNNAHVVIESSDASVKDTNINSGAKLEVEDSVSTINPFKSIKISPSEDGQTIILDGKFQSIEIEKGAKVEISPNAQICGTLTIASDAEVSLADNAVVKRVNIATENEDDKVVLSGNFSNVVIDKKADIEIKSGNSNITSNVPVDINVEENASITAKGNTSNINNTGNGNVAENENKSSNNKIENVLFDNVTFDNYGLKNVPAGITISEFLNNIQLPDFSNAVIKDSKDNVISKDNYLLQKSKLFVIAEDGSEKEYYIILAHNASHPFIPGIKVDKFVDTNNNDAFISGTLSFTGVDDEENIQGYYVNIDYSTIEEEIYNDENRPYVTHKFLWGTFVPVSSKNNDKYNITFDNLNIGDNKDLSVSITAVLDNKTLYACVGADWLLLDNPNKSLKPSIKGVTIKDFVDKNSKKGEIDGTIEFTKADDEDNIKYYEIRIFKSYELNGRKTGTYHPLGIILPDGSDKYSIDVPNHISDNVDFINANSISIIVTATNEYGEKSLNIEKSLSDIGEEDLKLNAPGLYLNGEEEYSLRVLHILEDVTVYLYEYDANKNEYVPKLDKNGEKVYAESHGSEAKFYNLEPGEYKVTQFTQGKESELSGSVILEPARLNVIIEGSRINFTNAFEGAIIKLYDEFKNEVLETITLSEDSPNCIENIEGGTYFITQTVNGIESISTKVIIEGNESQKIEKLNRLNQLLIEHKDNNHGTWWDGLSEVKNIIDELKVSDNTEYVEFASGGKANTLAHMDSYITESGFQSISELKKAFDEAVEKESKIEKLSLFVDKQYGNVESVIVNFPWHADDNNYNNFGYCPITYQNYGGWTSNYKQEVDVNADGSLVKIDGLFNEYRRSDFYHIVYIVTDKYLLKYDATIDHPIDTINLQPEGNYLEASKIVQYTDSDLKDGRLSLKCYNKLDNKDVYAGKIKLDLLIPEDEYILDDYYYRWPLYN